MTHRPPPRIASWLLERLISGPTRDALIGDLAEAFAAGRSRRWYWRQAVAAIAASVARVVREHKALTLRALVTGWVAYGLTASVANALTVETRDNVLGWLAAAGVDSPESFYWVTRIPGTVFPYLACFASGWAVGRLHRRGAAAVVCFAATVLILEYSMVIVLITLSTRAAPPPSSLLLHLVLLAGRPLAALLGGMAGVGTNFEPLRRA